MRKTGLFFLLFIALLATPLGCRQRGGARVGEINLSRVKDGRYGGNAVLAGEVVVVAVTVKFQKITDILVLRNVPGEKGRMALAITAQVIARQTLKVPLIEGAEQECRAILKAIENALKPNARRIP